MSRNLTILSCGPAMTIQDKGRRGYLAQGLTRGGAADMTALHEGAALLGQSPDLAAIEMVGMGGQFRADADIRIALTGAPMSAKLDDEPLVWNASHLLPAGSVLSIGGAHSGTYGYLHLGGGIDTPVMMGARSAHLSGGIGAALQANETLPIGNDKGTTTGMTLPVKNRFEGGLIRITSSMQTEQFDRQTITRFTSTEFKRDPRGNRMGVRMDHQGDPFHAADQLTILSDVIATGDIQVAGDGAPFVLMCECQTTGGYPRIGTVLPSDMARVAQAPAGAAISFQFVELEEARAIEQRAQTALATLAGSLTPLLRDPATIRDLLSYQLISGVVSGTSDPTQFEE
ncbi:biotin-dependent carboxyltransferase family protein [Sulfitobacter donghicola]|uniref:Urea amidolyase n=1 Tax=Sulfitobacter donghicola DSW-25 = KCTC 12864 = JCM 14565 TaxID=1300350 RepID=A0A073IZC8_9RHOB|nr:biotin-dependent carboxyltransferase family protein [Sulfitobacter donghicola]KEJ90777.1 urea amidolyase [Sulfitobacter donghicola DSW-25 = KCTC 12864 = JCM 14565]KIN68036.1 Allophanate hydrolase subunit 2 [Sulfitobacter donghicola DSW-25 = KCTC 12864 = JCM 14565]